VNEGDVIARLDLKSINRQIELLEREIRSSALQLKNTRERAALDEAAAKATLVDKQLDLDLTRRSLKGWEKYELEFQQRDAEMRKQSTENWIEDQMDELAQLEAMYSDDELVDATEEIVIKRARRDLARSNAALDLMLKKREYTVSFTEPSQTERKRMQLRTKELALERLIKTQEMERRTREDGILKAELAYQDQRDKLERLHRDRELLTLRAPTSGVLLHGSVDQYRPGQVAPRHKRGSRLGLRTTLFLVANPDQFNLALSIPEDKIDTLKTGLGATVMPKTLSHIQGVGVLRVDRFPSPKSAAAPENTYEAMVAIEGTMMGLVTGMRGKAEIRSERFKDAIVIPKNAVFGDEKEPHCWVADGETGEYYRADLELGPEWEGEVVVLDGVEENQKVLLKAPEK
jgi:multidrug efflux pump subunit AcrA (membrane-fusion protein)